ncbi:MAG: sugar phosphate isomerase/epimerase [Planctomycetaceae bacterium]|nr:sugar phosphate isomerase/epimerase [Planctomycetaceae bacterium]
MKLGLNINTFSGSDALQGCLELTQGFGIRNVELWANNCAVIGESPSGFAFSGKDLDAAEKLLAKFDITVCCLTFGGGLDRGFAADRQGFAKEFVYAVEVAKRFGAGIINHYADEFFDGNGLDMAALEVMWKPAIRKAEELGIVLALENEAHDFTQSPKTMKKVIDHFASPSFKTNYDPNNYFH